MTTKVSTTTSLNPAQWTMLLRLESRSAPISDIRAWIAASSADWADVLGLAEQGLIRNCTTEDGSFPQRQPINYGDATAAISPRGSIVTRTRIAPQRAVLLQLAGKPAGMPLRRLMTVTGATAEVLDPLNRAGFISVTGPDGAPMTIDEAEGRRRVGVHVQIAALGKPYLAS